MNLGLLVLPGSRCLRCVLWAVGLFLLAVTTARAQRTPALQMALGNPNNATTNPMQRMSFLIQLPQYALSYNAEDGIPNWVSWHLSKQDMGQVNRGTFAPNPALPRGAYQVTPKDYDNSGYERGQNCPSGDRTATRKDNDATFLMSNVIPQAAGINQGPWGKLEAYTRDLVKKGNEAYIICGGGGMSKRIAGNRIRVPAFLWKVIVVLPAGKKAPQDITPTTRVIAVRIHNDRASANKDWREFRVTVREVEKALGYDLLSKAPKQIQDALAVCRRERDAVFRALLSERKFRS